MKRIAVVVFLSLAFTAQVFASDVHRYIVATRSAARQAVHEVIGRDIAVREGMDIETFSAVDAFAADNTARQTADMPGR